MEPSVFRESPLSPSDVANYLRDELKRLRKRRQIVTSDSAATVTAAGHSELKFRKMPIFVGQKHIF